MFLLGQLICVRPSSEIDVYTHTSIIHKILCGKYGKDIISEVSQPFLSRKQHISGCTKSRYHKNKMWEQMTTFKLDSNSHVSWPEKVPHETIFKQLNEYLEGTQWTLPPPWAVCSHQIHDMEVMSIIVDGNSLFIPLHFDMLCITDPFIIQNCIVQAILQNSCLTVSLSMVSCCTNQLLIICLEAMYIWTFVHNAIHLSQKSQCLNWLWLITYIEVVFLAYLMIWNGWRKWFVPDIIIWLTSHVFFNLMILHYPMFYTATHMHMKWMLFPQWQSFHELLLIYWNAECCVYWARKVSNWIS